MCNSSRLLLAFSSDQKYSERKKFLVRRTGKGVSLFMIQSVQNSLFSLQNKGSDKIFHAVAKADIGVRRLSTKSLLAISSDISDL